MGSTTVVTPSLVPFAEVVKLYELMQKNTNDKARGRLIRLFRQKLRRPSGELFQVYRLLLPQVCARVGFRSWWLILPCAQPRDIFHDGSTTLFGVMQEDRTRGNYNMKEVRLG